MKMASRNFLNRFPRVVTATVIASMLAAATLAARQFATFQEEFEGELWEMVGIVRPTAGPVNGLVFTESNGHLYLADAGAETIIVYDKTLAVVGGFENADWAEGQSSDESSPVFGWAPNQLTTATVQVDGGADQTAILVSDLATGAHRVFAFTTAGEHLFTLHLDSSAVGNTPGYLNGIALAPGSKFILSTDDKVTLVGSFAAGWGHDLRTFGGTLAFHNSEFPFTPGNGHYEAVPTKVLTGDEQVPGVDDAVHALEPFGLTFDGAGNLYMTDSTTERLTVYGAGPTFTRRFTFGTPEDNDGTTAEFFESYAIQFWPDGTGSGGRLFVADAINNRVLAYRPNFADKTLDSIFALDGIGALNGFPYGMAIDTVSGRIAIGDDFGDQIGQRAWILKTPDLAAFHVRLLDETGTAALPGGDTPVVCAGEPYLVRFSLTVPAGRGLVTNVAPQLTINGQVTSAQPVAEGGYQNQGLSLAAGNVATFTYSLTAPTDLDPLELVAGVDLSALDGAHVLSRTIVLNVSSCDDPPPTVTTVENPLPQLSGWTAVRPGQTASVTIEATDPLGVRQINYQIDGKNHTIPLDPVENSDPQATTQTHQVLLPALLDSQIHYKALNNAFVYSELATLEVFLVAVPDRLNNEGEVIPAFTIGVPQNPAGVSYRQTGLPDGLTFNTSTREIGGTLSSVSAGVHTVTIFESRGTGPSLEESSFSFVWTVNNRNSVPVSVGESYSTAEDTALVVAAPGVLGNDSDPDGSPLTMTGVREPLHGRLVWAANGGFTYTPDANYHGPDNFLYRAYDGETQGPDVTVSLTVTPVNDPPVGAPDLLNATEDTPVTYPASALLGNDSDPEGSTLTIAAVASGTGGTVVRNPDGTVRFTPAANFVGNATFTYTLSDGTATVGPVTVTVNVTGVIDTPVAANDTLSATEDTVAFFTTAQLVTNDTDPENVPLWIWALTPGIGGTVVLEGTNVKFTPAPNFSGPATFTYAVSNGTHHSNTATVTVNVAAVNDPPVAVPDTVSALYGQPATFAATVLTVNDTDPEPGTVLTIASVSNGTNGTVVRNANGSVTFTPTLGFSGLATFSYTVTDGSLTSTTTVTVIVAANTPPVGTPDTVSALEDTVATFAAATLLTNDVDAEAATLSIASVASGTGGTVVLDGTNVRFTPAANFYGVATFTYVVTDGGLTSLPVVVTVNVTPVNDAPSFTAGANASVNEDAGAQTVPGWATALSAGPNESQALTFFASNNNNGLFSGQPAISANGTLTYTPVANAFGIATVTVYLKDDGGTANSGIDTSATRTFTITVNAVNDAPTAGADSATSAGAAPVEIPVLANDADIDGGVLSVSTFTQPTTGGVVTSSGNLLVFTPTPGFIGTVTFSYVVVDGNGGSATATVTVTVTGAVCSGPTTALIRQQVMFNSGSRLEGSVQVMTASNVTFNGGTLVGDLLMLGTPAIQLNGTPSPYGGVVVGSGAATPTNHVVTINSGVGLGRIMTRTNAVALPTVAAPPASVGTRDVSLNSSTESAGNFATLRDLTLNSNVGPVTVPAGTYRAFTANTNTSFVIGVAGATTPSVYNFETLTLNSGSSLQVVGPVIVTVKNSFAPNGPVGSSAHPEWLTFRVAATGGMSLNSGSSLYGYAEVPNGPVTINDTTQLVGGLAADSLTLNSNGRLILRADCTPNQAPTVSAVDRSDNRGSAVSLQISGSDQDGDALTYTVSGLPPGVSMTPAGLITGTLTTSGTYTVTVTVTDTAGATGTATFTWTVVTPNQAPATQNDSVNTVGAAPVTIPVLGNDSDPDGGTLSIVSFTVPTGGTVTTSGNQLVFTPNPGFVGTTTFTYVVSDGQGGTAIGTVTITVAAAPACSLSGYLTYSQGGWGNSGAPGQFLAYYFANVYPAGHVTIGGVKTLKFTSASAVDAFLPQGGSPNVLTSSVVNPTSSSAGNFAAQLLALRLAVDFSAAGITKRGLGQLEMVSGPLAGKTVDEILAIANTVIGGTTSALPSGMTVSTLSGILDSLNLNFHEGTDNNGLLRCAGGTTTCSAVTMATTGSGSTLSGTAGNIRSFSSGGVNVKVSGFARAKSNGAWSTAYLGAWSVGMGVTDGSEGDGSGDMHKLDNVGDRVNYMLFEFSQPVVVTKAYLAYIGVSSNATVWIGTKTDPYNNHLTLSDALLTTLGTPQDSTGTSTAAHWRAFNGGATAGNVLVIAARTSGSSDAFKVAQLEFKPCGGTPANQPPTVSAADRSDNIGGTVNLQLAGDDPEDGTLTYAAQGLPAGLSMTTAGKITGAPTTAGTYTVTVTVTDAANATATDTFVWTVVQPNRAPNAVNDSVATNPTKTVTVNVRSNDTDADGDTLTITSVTQPSKGSTSIQSGAITYVAPASGTGTTTFSYTVSDGRGGEDTATVTVTLTNPAPVATDDAANVVKSGSKTLTVLANDVLAGLTGTVTIVSQPSKGSVTVNSNGTITYKASSSTGTTSFTYKVTTSAGNDTATVAITITSSTNGSGHSSGNHGSCSH